MIYKCWNYKHRHEFLTEANECIAKHERLKAKPQNKWTAEKYAELLKIWRDGGITKKDIGKRYGVTGHHIGMVIKKAERLEVK